MKRTHKNKMTRTLLASSRPLASLSRRLTSSILALCVLALGAKMAQASVAYGSINNFDTVNDTSNVCHGFEIELDDIHSTDITYTYDYNHYGVPKITEDTFSVPGHTNVIVRYEAVYSANTGWSAYTAIPTNNIPPTQGHAFTNPSLNFGGEHFGVGYRRSPAKVYYYWLTNSGSSLVRGPQVYVSTPVFTTPAPVVVGQPVAVMPVIPAPVLPVAPPPLVNPNGIAYEFSDATWVKVIATTSHTNNPIELRELITPDTNNPSAKDWRNGEPSEVETEWQLLQTDFGANPNAPPPNGGANGQLANHTNNVASDDVVTYRYEYYAYVGPYSDWDTHEALAQSVATNGIFGVGTYVDQNGITNNLSTVPVVGRFLGAQMSAMAATPPVGLIDHLPDAEEGVLYPTRTVVIAGDNTNFTATCTGLPAGMSFEAANGWVGNTPSTSGVFIVTVSVSASNSPVLTKNYPLLVAPRGVVLPPHSAVDTSVFPTNGGTATGEGVYTNGTTATVVATASAGFKFVYWTENGVVVSTLASYTFTNMINQSLVANFIAVPWLSFAKQPQSLVLTWPTNFPGFTLQQNSNLKTTNWGAAAEAVNTVGTNYQATILTTNGPRLFRLMHP